MSGGIFAVLDDISVLLDDVATVTRVSIKQTSPLLADDLAVNAEKASGFASSRELPVLWAIIKGSFLNKIILLPFGFLLMSFIPWIIPPILIIGGLYLSFEGAEKVYEYIYSLYKNNKKHNTGKKLTEKEKIRSSILTDFILSIEIIVIALSTVIKEELIIQIVVVSIVAFAATVGVYGIVALIVRLDDIGFFFIKNSEKNSLKSRFGELLVISLPFIVKFLSIIGVLAMFLVAGGIFIHNIHRLNEFTIAIGSILPTTIFEFFLSLFVGFFMLIIGFLIKKVKNRVKI